MMTVLYELKTGNMVETFEIGLLQKIRAMQLLRHKLTSCVLRTINVCSLNIELPRYLPWRLGSRKSEMSFGNYHV